MTAAAALLVASLASRAPAATIRFRRDIPEARAMLAAAQTEAKALSDWGRRANALAHIAAEQWIAGDGFGSRESISLATSTLTSAQQGWTVIDSLLVLGVAQASVGDVAEASATIHGAINVAVRSKIPRDVEIVEALAQAGLVDEALRYAEAEKEPYARSQEQVPVAIAFARRGDWPRAYAVSRGREDAEASAAVQMIHALHDWSAAMKADPEYHALASWVAPHLALAGDLRDAESVAKMISDPDSRRYAYTEMAVSCAIHGYDDRAIKLIRNRLSPEDRPYALMRMARAQAAGGRNAQARKTRDLMKDGGKSVSGYLQALNAAETGQPLDPIMQAITKLRDPGGYALMMIEELAKEGKVDIASQIFQRLSSLPKTDDLQTSLRAHKLLTQELARRGRFSEAREVAKSLDEGNPKEATIRRLAAMQAGAGDIDGAFETVSLLETGIFTVRPAAYEDMAEADQLNSYDHAPLRWLGRLKDPEERAFALLGSARGLRLSVERED